MAFAVIDYLAVDITTSVLIGKAGFATVHVAGVSETSGARIAAIIPIACAAIVPIAASAVDSYEVVSVRSDTDLQ